jgi:hypothetical protein
MGTNWLKHAESQGGLDCVGSVQLTPLQEASLIALEQGIWTVLSYYFLDDTNKALAITKDLKPSIKSIHEFDLERFEEIFKGIEVLYDKYRQISYNPLSIASAKSFSESYEKFMIRHHPFKRRTSDMDESNVHRYGIVAGAAIALERIAKNDPLSAENIAMIVSAPIGFSNADLNDFERLE